jgi:hypothetical protein
VYLTAENNQCQIMDIRQKVPSASYELSLPSAERVQFHSGGRGVLACKDGQWQHIDLVGAKVHAVSGVSLDGADVQYMSYKSGWICAGQNGLWMDDLVSPPVHYKLTDERAKFWWTEDNDGVMFASDNGQVHQWSPSHISPMYNINIVGIDTGSLILPQASGWKVARERGGQIQCQTIVYEALPVDDQVDNDDDALSYLVAETSIHPDLLAQVKQSTPTIIKAETSPISSERIKPTTSSKKAETIDVSRMVSTLNQTRHETDENELSNQQSSHIILGATAEKWMPKKKDQLMRLDACTFSIREMDPKPPGAIVGTRGLDALVDEGQRVIQVLQDRSEYSGMLLQNDDEDFESVLDVVLELMGVVMDGDQPLQLGDDVHCGIVWWVHSVVMQCRLGWDKVPMGKKAAMGGLKCASKWLLLSSVLIRQSSET